MADNNKLKDYEKNMTTWCKSVLGKYRIMKKLNKDAYKKSIQSKKEPCLLYTSPSPRD